MLGKLPPQATELEEAVLGAILLEKNAMLEIVDILTPDSFYKDAHKLIYQACLKLFDNNEPIDILTVSNELRKSEMLEHAGGAFYISELAQKVNSSANIVHHAAIIKEEYIKREIIAVATQAEQEGYSDSTDAFEVLESLDQALGKVQELARGKASGGLRAAIKENQEMAIKAKEDKTHLIGVSSGFVSIDKITHGWQPGHLIILGARPSMGKSALALQFAESPAYTFNKNVAFFSLEMTNTELVSRLISIKSEIPTERVKEGKMSNDDWELYKHTCKTIETSHLEISDIANQTVRSIKSECMVIAKKIGPIELVIVDYLQLMSGDGNTRHEIVGGISRGLKLLAKSMKAPVIALAQLSRALELRGGDKRPILSDLKESGDIEQDADIVMFLYRPEYYGFMNDDDGNSLAGIAEVNIAKHRGGRLGRVLLNFQHDITKFSEIDQHSSRSNQRNYDF